MEHCDALIVGAGPAGLSAALVLGRARRSVLLVDAGEPRNAAARRAHGFLTRDHTRPMDLLADGHRELARYPSVIRRHDTVHSIRATPEGFEAQTDQGLQVQSRALFLATGVQDQLPEIPGLAEAWGSRVHHCPYCDGWEYRDAPIAILGQGKRGAAIAAELHGWTPHLTLVTNGESHLTAHALHALAWHQIRVIETPIARFEEGQGMGMLHFADGSHLPVAALFLLPRQDKRVDPLAQQLDLARTPDGDLEVGPYGQTSQPRCFVIGDAARKIQQIAYAVGMGTAAAVALNQDLVQADFFGAVPPLRTIT